MERLVVVGNGMAGIGCVEQILKYDPPFQITVFGDETHVNYNRVLLSSVLAGEKNDDDIILNSREWYARHGIDLRVGVRVVDLDPIAKTVTGDDGATMAYDKVLLATGSSAWIPPIAGVDLDGVFVFRTLDDTRELLRRSGRGVKAVVIGGGLLGLEAARGLAGRGCPVTVVHPVGHLMERQLDPAGGHVLARVLGPKGIEFRLGQLATKYLPDKGLQLDDGSHVAAGLVVVSAGTRPETALAEAAGLTVDRGVVIDDRLRTSAADVYAIGDCAQHADVVGGLVQPAWEQASVLAGLLTGADPHARYRGTPLVTRLKTRDVDLASMGEVHVEPHTTDAEVVRLEDPSRGRYTKIVLRDDRVTGAIVLGAPDVAAAVTQLHDRGTPAPADRMALLLGRAMPAGSPASDPASLPASTLICRCNTVDKGRLVGAWHAGARSLDSLVSTTMAGTGCGGCRDTVCAMSRWLAEQDPLTDPEKLGCNAT